jgi:thiamine biosynthesis lipoprotein
LYIEMPYSTAAARMTSVTIVPTAELLHESKLRRIRPSPAARHCAFLAAVLAAQALPASAGWVGEALDLMGTRVSVELWADDEAYGRELVAEIVAEYRRIDAAMSTYRADSELSLVNSRAAVAAVPIDAELFGLLSRAKELSVASGGAFDITYESVGYLYDFRAGQHPNYYYLFSLSFGES